MWVNKYQLFAACLRAQRRRFARKRIAKDTWVQGVRLWIGGHLSHWHIFGLVSFHGQTAVMHLLAPWPLELVLHCVVLSPDVNGWPEVRTFSYPLADILQWFVEHQESFRRSKITIKHHFIDSVAYSMVLKRLPSGVCKALRDNFSDPDVEASASIGSFRTMIWGRDIDTAGTADCFAVIGTWFGNVSWSWRSELANILTSKENLLII